MSLHYEGDIISLCDRPGFIWIPNINSHTTILTHIAGVHHVNLNLKCTFAKSLYKTINSENERITFLDKLCMYNTNLIIGNVT